MSYSIDDFFNEILLELHGGVENGDASSHGPEAMDVDLLPAGQLDPSTKEGSNSSYDKSDKDNAETGASESASLSDAEDMELDPQPVQQLDPQGEQEVTDNHRANKQDGAAAGPVDGVDEVQRLNELILAEADWDITIQSQFEALTVAHNEHGQSRENVTSAVPPEVANCMGPYADAPVIVEMWANGEVSMPTNLESWKGLAGLMRIHPEARTNRAILIDLFQCYAYQPHNGYPKKRSSFGIPLDRSIDRGRSYDTSDSEEPAFEHQNNIRTGSGTSVDAFNDDHDEELAPYDTSGSEEAAREHQNDTQMGSNASLDIANDEQVEELAPMTSNAPATATPATIAGDAEGITSASEATQTEANTPAVRFTRSMSKTPASSPVYIYANEASSSPLDPYNSDIAMGDADTTASNPRHSHTLPCAISSVDANGKKSLIVMLKINGALLEEKAASDRVRKHLAKDPNWQPEPSKRREDIFEEEDDLYSHPASSGHRGDASTSSVSRSWGCRLNSTTRPSGANSSRPPRPSRARSPLPTMSMLSDMWKFKELSDLARPAPSRPLNLAALPVPQDASPPPQPPASRLRADNYAARYPFPPYREHKTKHLTELFIRGVHNGLSNVREDAETAPDASLGELVAHLEANAPNLGSYRREDDRAPVLRGCEWVYGALGALWTDAWTDIDDALRLAGGERDEEVVRRGACAWVPPLAACDALDVHVQIQNRFVMKRFLGEGAENGLDG